jgi:hypothetical protein
MGSLVLAGATSGSTTITPTDAVTATLTLPSTTGTLGLASGSATQSINAQNTFGFKNRIINGGMVIDQRNAGASVSNNGYIIDRFAFDRGVSTAVVTGQQSSTVPSSGFSNSVVLTVTSGAATTSGDYSVFRQAIEGYNVADLNWGTSSAKTVTLSFWVRSSLTGTFGVSFVNSAQNRYYIGSYTISATNTWEQKSITVSGDQSGTWVTTNGAGINIYWDIGVGTTYSASSGSWGTGAGVYGLTGGVKLLANTGATLYITGVQLEVGTQATSFDFRDYGRELILCQRYYYLHAGTFVNPNSTTVTPIGIGSQEDSTLAITHVPFKVNMRSAPTLVVSTGTDYYRFTRAGGTDLFNSFSLDSAITTIASIYNATEISGTAGWAGRMMTNSTSASVAFNAEL